MRAKQTQKRRRAVRRHRLALALVGAMAMPATVLAQNLPVGGSVVNGTASVSTTGPQMTVTQTTKGAIIDWGSFSIGSGYGVTFDQQFGASSVTLNRVVGFGYGVTPSSIDGTLTANGSVFLINPAGITFGSGAVVNVGGLVASTLWMNSGDFIAGLSSGQYVFNGFNGDPSTVHAIRNNGAITAGSGGVAFVGQSLINDGSIIANGGNIGFGAATAVTLDFVGDGLTQVTITAPPTLDSGIGQTSDGSMIADGGKILLRTATTAGGTGGGIMASGVLRAQSIANVNGRIELTSAGGMVMVGALGVLSDASTPYTQGTLDVSGQAGESGGSVLIQAADVWLVNNDPTPNAPSDPTSVGSMILANGDTVGGQVQIQATGQVQGMERTLIAADGQNGSGGQVTISAAGNIILQGNTSAASKIGAGGSVQIGSSTGSVVLAGSVVAAGNTDGGSISLLAPQGLLGIDSAVSASGGSGDGGQILALAEDILLTENSGLYANSAAAQGGAIQVGATDVLAAFGLLDASGATAGGSILTRFGGQFDFRGLQVNAGGSTAAGSWTLQSSGSLGVVNGSAVGTAATMTLGTTLQDAEINAALANGTNVTLETDGSVDFSAGADIFYDDGSIPLYFQVSADGAITGNNFSITSNLAPLSMGFNANADGIGTGDIRFTGATLDSIGGDILFYGESDPTGGAASGIDTGVYIGSSNITTGGGSLLMRGESTGGGTAPVVAGVALLGNNIDVGSGGVQIFGNGLNGAGGIIADANSITAAGGDVLLEGRSATGDGVRLDGTGIASGGGDIAILGYGGGIGVYAEYGDLASGGGNIVVHGEGVTGNGVDMSALLASGGGDIAMYGSSTNAMGLVFGGGYYGGIASAGGDIALEGHGATGGVALLADNYGPAAIDSVGGDIDVTGSASTTDAIGVYSDGIDLVGGAGDVTVDGSSPLGIGVLFANGAGVSTTTGAISLTGTGANFGLDIADGAIDTDSGDITLIGDALAATATAGVRVTGAGLTTDGGTISVTGNSAGGVGVQLGDGSTFAIASGGGAILIDGTGIDAGVLMQGNQVASGGGVVSITGSGGALGVSLDGSDVDSGGGVIDVIGAASGTGGVGVDLDDARVLAGAGDVRVFGNAAGGSGVNFTGSSAIVTTTGAIAMTGIGATVGLALNGGTLSTDSGHFDLRGRGTGAASDGLLIGSGMSIATEGGGIELSGEGGSGAGLWLQSGASVDAGNSLVVVRAGNDGSSDAIRIDGSIASAMGVNLRPGGVDANGNLVERVDDEILIGGGSGGFVLSGAELAMIDAPQLVIGSSLHAGAIRVLGATSRDGDLTLQNDGGSGGIELQASLDVGSGTLALSSGGDIVQSAAGAITAHSLLARAGGDVLLADAGNNVAANTLAGSAGGAFEYQDVDALAIGSVSALGMDAASNGLASFGATGIAAGGNVFVRNLAGDMTLNAGVSGVNIDLVTANTLQNLAGASLVASGDWRVWANSWVGETRGGLAGSGDLPNLYGCTYLGQCGVTVPGADNHFIYVQRPTALVSFDDFTREYGLPNPVFTFTVTGAILGDSAANVATGTGITTATIGSNVGSYAITGNFTSAAGYNIQFDPGTLSITPATLLFTADPFVRYLGTPNPLFTGTVTGFRNGDTVQSVFGSGVIWSSPAGILSPIGYYPVNGGTSATNYVFAQAPGNATALQIIPLPQLSSTPIDLIRETVNTYVYDRNFGGAPICALNASLEDQQLASSGDQLSNEWTKVRSRPNLTNCFDSERRSSCGDF